jgi:uncharacterized membrane protein
MRWNWLLLSCILIASICSASFVHGEIYGQDLQKLNNTVITIQGAFSYQLVSEKSNYSIFLPPGHYTISASASGIDGKELFVEEKIIAGADDQQLDLVLKPGSDMGSLLYIGAFVLLAAVLSIVLFLWLDTNRKPKPAAPGPDALHIAKPMELDSDAKSVLRVLDGMEGRATQKDLRESLGFSDAKLSLILSELESIGKVKKFKRGRGNIVRKTSD